MPKAKINVTQDEEDLVPKEVLAKEICKLSDNAGKLIASGLNEEAVVVLLSDSAKMPKGKIRHVLQCLSQLRADYTHD